jgi:hypothetical protein
MSAAALRGIVSGLYGKRRSQRLLFMLQAFIDESEDKDRTVLSLGGYISTYEKWELFDSEWQLILHRYPRIEYFKYRECFRANGDYRGDGQFRGIDENDAMSKVADLYKVIGDHALAYVSCAVNPKTYGRVFGRFPKPMKSPYYLCLLKIMTGLPKILHDTGLGSPVEFIFDRQMMEEKSILEAWCSFEEQGFIDKSLVSSSPSFKDDKDVRPLQAGDMLAGRMRNSLLNQLRVTQPSPIPMRLPIQKAIPGHHFVITEGEIIGLSEFMDRAFRTSITGTLGSQVFMSMNLSALRGVA